MPDFPELPIINPPPKPFPELPIVTPDPPRMTLREKYGNLYYLSIAGLAISVTLVSLFAFGLWATRDYWYAIYVMDDPERPEAERIEAAWVVARHPASNEVHRVDFALRKDLPPLARYVIAERITSEAIRSDPKGYAEKVARSEGWPDWLRLLLVRPMAYGVGEGYRIAWEPLDLLRQNSDPAIALWATYTRAVMAPGDALALGSLEAEARKPGPNQALAVLLKAAARADGETRVGKLDEATLWLRTHHPEAAKFWNGWTEKDGRLISTAPAGSTRPINGAAGRPPGGSH